MTGQHNVAAKRDTYAAPAPREPSPKLLPRPIEVLAPRLATYRAVRHLLGHVGLARWVRSGGSFGRTLAWPRDDDERLDVADQLPVLADLVRLAPQIRRVLNVRLDTSEIRSQCWAAVALARQNAKPADAAALADEIELENAESKIAPAVLAAAIWRHRQASPFAPSLSELRAQISAARSEMLEAMWLAEWLADELNAEIDRRLAAGLEPFFDGYEGDDDGW